MKISYEVGTPLTPITVKVTERILSFNIRKTLPVSGKVCFPFSGFLPCFGVVD
jgi:hypothetical protein